MKTIFIFEPNNNQCGCSLAGAEATDCSIQRYQLSPHQSVKISKQSPAKEHCLTFTNDAGIYISRHFIAVPFTPEDIMPGCKGTMTSVSPTVPRDVETTIKRVVHNFFPEAIRYTANDTRAKHQLKMRLSLLRGRGNFFFAPLNQLHSTQASHTLKQA